MKLILLTFILSLSLFSKTSFANMDEISEYIPDARVLVEARDYLKEVKDILGSGGNLPRNELQKLEVILEDIAEEGCDCPEEDHLIRGQAYALMGAINGIIAKETRSIGHGKKSYYQLERARELDPRNVDAIRGQGEALKAILSRGALARGIVSMALGINLNWETRQLIRDLRTFEEHQILLGLADQLQKLL